MNESQAKSRSHRRIYAALDLGTNNCRLLIARPEGSGFRVVDAFSRIVRLGEGVAASGRLGEEAMARTLAALGVCAGKMRRRGVERAHCIATQACRWAENGSDFLARIEAETGLDFEIIEAETEAALALAEAGADLISIETMCDVREARAAVVGARRSALPVIASMTFGQAGDSFQSLAGNSLEECLNALETVGATAVGLNCNLDSQQARLLAMSALTMTGLPLVVQPCAGQPTEQLGKLAYPETVASFADNQLALARAQLRSPPCARALMT